MIIPSWALISLGSAFTLAIMSISDKVLLTKYLTYKQMLFFGPFRLVLFLPCFFFLKINLSLQVLALTFLLAVMILFSSVFYFLGLKNSEVSRIVPLYSATPLVTALISAVFLSEIFKPMVYLGVIFIVLGTVLISYEHSAKIKFNKKAIALILISVLFSAFYNVISKYSLGFADVLSVFFLAFGFVSVLYGFTWFTEDWQATLGKIRSKPVALLLCTSFLLPLLSNWLFIWAVSLGSATQASALTETYSFFVLIIAAIIAYFNKEAIKEKFSIFSFAQKFVAIALLFAGVLLII